MSSTGISYPHAITLPSGGPITQITECSPAFNLEDLELTSAGQTSPQFTGAHQAKHDLNFSCREIATVLGACDVEAIMKDFSSDNVDLYYKRGSSSGLRVADATASHLRGRMEDNAVLVWESIRVRQGETAEIRARLFPIWDGTNVPLVFTGSVALSGTSAAAEAFTLGPAKINGTFLPSLIEMEWNNNIQYEEVFSNGDAYMTYAGVRHYSPVITLRTRDATAIATYGQQTAISSFSQFLRRKSASGFNVSDATETNIGFTASSGTIRARGVSGMDAMTEITVHLTKPNATSAPFAVDTTAAIS